MKRSYNDLRKDTKENIFSNYKLVVKKLDDWPPHKYSFEDSSFFNELYDEFDEYEWYGGFINNELVSMAVIKRNKGKISVLHASSISIYKQFNPDDLLVEFLKNQK